MHMCIIRLTVIVHICITPPNEHPARQWRQAVANPDWTDPLDWEDPVDFPRGSHAVIEAEGSFKVLRLASMCAYGSFATREEAEEAIAQSAMADQLARCGQ